MHMFSTFLLSFNEYYLVLGICIICLLSMVYLIFFKEISDESDEEQVGDKDDDLTE